MTVLNVTIVAIIRLMCHRCSLIVLLIFTIETQHSSVAWTECWILNVLDSSPMWIKYSWQRTWPCSRPKSFLINSFSTIVVFLLVPNNSCSFSTSSSMLQMSSVSSITTCYNENVMYFFRAYFLILLQNDSVLSVSHLAFGVGPISVFKTCRDMILWNIITDVLLLEYLSIHPQTIDNIINMLFYCTH